MIFVFDWDGTLGGHESVLNKSSERALQYLNAKGYEVIIATGRGPRDVLNRLGSASKYVSRYVIGSNGGVILDREKDEIVFKATLSDEATQQTIKYAQDNNLIFGVICEEDTYFFRANDQAPFKTISPLYGNIEKIFTNDDYKIFKDRIALIGMAFDKDIDKHFQGLTDAVPKANIHFADKIWLQSVPYGVTKFEGIKKVLGWLGKETTEVIAFGDSGNDIPMLKGAHIGIAMGDAKEDVKAAANIVIDLAKNDAIEKYVKENY